MSKGIANACTVLVTTVVLMACASSPEPTQPTADELARASYARIVSGANVLLLGDVLGYFGTDDTVERLGTRCRDDTCAIGFSWFSLAGDFGVEDFELELPGERRGVSLVVETASWSDFDVHVYGGWLEHSFFASETTLHNQADHPERGITTVHSYANGFSTGENPSGVEGSARWEGVVIGRDMSASASRGQVILGDADVTLEFGGSAVTADVAFTEMANIETGERRDNMAWRGMAVENGGFARRDAPDNTISGQFFGPDEEEVGGIFERDGIAGAFGGTRASH